MLRTYEENSIGREMDPAREAEYFHHLKTELRFTQREIVGYLGISEAQVSSRLALLGDTDLARRVERGELSATAARQEVWSRGPQARGKGANHGSGERTEAKEAVTRESGADLDPLSILNELALRLQGLWNQVDELDREQHLRLG